MLYMARLSDRQANTALPVGAVHIVRSVMSRSGIERFAIFNCESKHWRNRCLSSIFRTVQWDIPWKCG